MKNKKLIEKYNIAVPRYTSYPPANFFEDINSKEYIKYVENSNKFGEKNISFYIHIPFCKNQCLYCGCNMMLIQSNLFIEEYFKALKKEIEIITNKIDKTKKLSQIHYGGGTPNAVNIKYLQEINQILLSKFNTIENPEIAIEAHPALLDEDYINGIIKAKFNRISIGIQDFDEKVLKNVARLPPKIKIEKIINLLREKNPSININFDFIYGLAGQTIESFEKTIKKAISLKPNRLVTFSYAHIPSIKSHQKILEKIGLPDLQTKAKMYENSKKILLQAGYKQIGLDHFVLESDDLYKAIKQKKLARNFQGYCTKKTTGQVFAFGTSAISQLEGGFFQNTKDIKKYIKTLKNNQLTTEKGIIFTQNQKIIGKAIENLMCNYYLDLNELSLILGKKKDEIKKILNFNKQNFSDFINDNLIKFDKDFLEVLEDGKVFIRNIASRIDENFKNSKKTFSKSI